MALLHQCAEKGQSVSPPVGLLELVGPVWLLEPAGPVEQALLRSELNYTTLSLWCPVEQARLASGVLVWMCGEKD